MSAAPQRSNRVRVFRDLAKAGGSGLHGEAASLSYNVTMTQTHPAPDTALADDDLRTCVRVLRAIEADRSHLTRLTQDQRRELLTLAGLIAKPERHDLVRMAKAFRRAEREAMKEHDRKVLATAGLRIQRRAAEYAPLWLEPPKPEDLRRAARVPSRRATATFASSPLPACIATTIRCASAAAISTMPSASKPLISAGTMRWSPAPGSKSASRLPSSCCAPAHTSSSPRASPSTPRNATRRKRIIRRFSGRLQMSWPGPAAHAQRGNFHAIPLGTPAAARLHSQ